MNMEAYSYILARILRHCLSSVLMMTAASRLCEDVIEIKNWFNTFLLNIHGSAIKYNIILLLSTILIELKHNIIIQVVSVGVHRVNNPNHLTELVLFFLYKLFPSHKTYFLRYLYSGPIQIKYSHIVNNSIRTSLEDFN